MQLNTGVKEAIPASSLWAYLPVRHEGHASHLVPSVLGSNWAVLRVRTRSSYWVSDWSTAVLRHTSQRGSSNYSSVSQSQPQVHHGQLNVGREKERQTESTRPSEKNWRKRKRERDMCKEDLWEKEEKIHINRPRKESQGKKQERERGEKERGSNW